MSKTEKDENFPVGMLVSAPLKPWVQLYYQAARQADDIADNPEIEAEEKLRLLMQAEKDFFAQTDSIAGKLGELFAAENLDSSLYTDLLAAFRRDARGETIEIWEQLLDYCRYSAAPVGRFMLAIHNENPSTYLPAETLCAVLQISNHLQDIKTDMCSLQRCYMPQDMLKQYGVAKSDLYLSAETPQLRALKHEICRRLRAMLQDAMVLPCLVRSLRLKAELGVIFSLTNFVLKKIEQKDIVASPIRLNRFDWCAALVWGSLKGIFARTKSCNRSHK